jgi:tight adherence protein C
MSVGTPRRTALDGLAARCPLPAVTALVAAVHRADRHGVPLAPSLAALAADARADRVRLLADHAARAAPKIQLVIALLLVPAVLLLVAAAMVGTL